MTQQYSERITPEQVAALRDRADLVSAQDVRMFLHLLHRVRKTFDSIQNARHGVPYDVGFFDMLFRGHTKTVEFRFDEFLALAEWRYELFMQLVAKHGRSDERNLVPPWDVTIIFLSHLMQPVAFIEDVEQRCFSENSSLLKYKFPLAVLESGPSRPLNDHTAGLWAATFGKTAPFEAYDYLPDGEVVRLKDSWAANVMITRWTTEAVSADQSRRRSRLSWPMTGHMLQGQQMFACDISVWSRVRMGALEPPWLERENPGNHTAGVMSGDIRTCMQLGKKRNTRLQPQRRNAFMSKEAEPGEFDTSASSPLEPEGTTEDGKKVGFAGTSERQKSDLLFPCISISLLAAAKRLQRFADTADEWLRTTTTMPDLMVHRFYQFLAIIAQEHVNDKIHAPATESPKLPGKAAVVAERSSSNSFAEREVVRTLMVPPIDVDIVWRAALLSPSQYLEWSRKDLGSILDHTLDSLGPVEVSEGRMLASEAWSTAYPGQAPLRPRRVTNPD